MGGGKSVYNIKNEEMWEQIRRAGAASALIGQLSWNYGQAAQKLWFTAL